MELRQLRYFVAVAEALNFSRAAEHLHIAQPPLSQQIRQLEAELGVQLFLRTKRRVQLTDAGQIILSEARRTLQQAERLRQIAQQTRCGEVGRLAIGFASSAPYTLLPAMLRCFRQQFPQVCLSLQELSRERQIQRLDEGSLDVGFMRPPVEDREAALSVELILREPLVVALPETHRLAQQAEVPIQALAREAFVLFPRLVAPGLYDQILGACQRAGFRPQVAQEATQMQMIISLVSAGLGVALVPASMQNLQRAQVLYRNLLPGTDTTEMALVHRQDNPSPVLPAFLSVVRALAQGDLNPPEPTLEASVTQP